MKNKTLLILALTVIALPLILNAQTRRRSTNTSTNTNGNVTSCGDISVTFDKRPAITEESEMTIPASQLSTFRAQASNNGIYVTGWDRAEYSVKTCKAVSPEETNAASLLKEITTTNDGGRISVNGPSGSEWIANLIVMTPRLANLDLQAANGPLQLRELAGVIHLSAANGPISLENVGGSVQATTANGPISIKGATGDHRLSATNGPINIALSGSRWDGPGLEASTQNGPLNLQIPDGYSSGVRIQASDHSPVTCKSVACAQASRSLGSPSIIRLGNGDPIVRLSTVNGPLSIQSPKN